MTDFIIGDNLELESFFKQNTNALHEENVVQRKNAITAIYKRVTDPNIAQSDCNNIDQGIELSQQILLKYGKELLKSFSDSAEKVRELAIKSMIELLTNSEDNEPLLNYVFSVLMERSNCQDLEGILHLPEVMRPPPSQLPLRLIKFIEPSEEVRLQLTQLLYTMMCKNDSDNLHEYIDEIVDIHRAFLMDPFGEVQKEACKSLTKFCKVNHQMLLHFTEKMGRAVLHPLISKKSPIRVAALEALSAVLLCGIWKNNAFVFEVLTGFKDPNSVPIKAFFEPMHNINYFATLIIDPKQQVRQAFIKEIGFWLRGLADRWDHHPRLVPYLLSGLFDSDPHIQEAALQIIEDVGKEWEVEKEKEVKDVKQLGIEPAWTQEGKLANLPLPSPFKQRPNIGMRGFIKCQVRKMWPALYKEIVEHNEESRLRASYLIVLGIIFSEDYMTQFLDHFIPNTIIAFRKAETKTDKQILANLQQTYQFIGRFCDFTSYSLIIFQSMRGKYIRDEQYTRNATQALNWLCKGAIEATLNRIGSKIEFLEKILELLCEGDQIEYMSSINQEEIFDLLMTIKASIETKANEEEKGTFYEKHSYKLNLLDNVINYIRNFSQILFHQQISPTQQIVYSQRQCLQQIDQIEKDFLYGDSKWKNLIGEIIHQLNAGSTLVYPLTDILHSYIVESQLPESIDFILKLSQLLLQSAQIKNVQLQFQVILKLLAGVGQWMNKLEQKTFSQKILDHLLSTLHTISNHFNKKRDIGKTMSKDQLSLEYFSSIVLALCISYQKLYKKQYSIIVTCVSGFCNFILPYPSSKHLIDTPNNRYLLPNLTQFIFEATDQLGNEQNQETRKCIFLMFSFLHQFIPVQETYIGDPHVVQDYQKYLQQLVRLCIEEKDLQSHDLFKIMLKDLCKKTRNNFLQEYEMVKYNNQLSRVELLNQIINQ